MGPVYFALFIRGPAGQIFELSDRLGFETEMHADAVSVFEDGPGMMYVQALFRTEHLAQTCVQTLALGKLEYSISPLPDEDWVSKSQRGLPPVRAGRFFVYGRHDQDKIPSDAVFPICIDAGLAFGTGHHGTTAGCLRAFERLNNDGFKPQTVLDLGCGSGVLAIAAAKVLHRPIMASDIDADAVNVTLANARINHVADYVSCQQADGVTGNADYDLIFANILAGPLMDMAAPLCTALRPGGRVILSGLLDAQAKAVRMCFQNQGLQDMHRLSLSGWTSLIMGKP